MPNEVTFIDEDAAIGKKRGTNATSKSAVARFLIRNGIAKTEGQANLLMIILTIICVAITIYLNQGEELIVSPPPTNQVSQ